jgi:hypothetical protein
MVCEAISEAAIFARLVHAGESRQAAGIELPLLTLKFSPQDQDRMQILAGRARQGILTDDEEQEIDNYERVGHYLSILQSKFRRVGENPKSEDFHEEKD